MAVVQFQGVHYNTMDEKGRVVMPAGFRRDVPPEVLEGDFYLTPEPEGHLMVRPREEFEDTMRRIKRSPLETRVKKQYIRRINQLTQRTSLDKQNRLVLTPMMRRRLGLEEAGKSEVVILGCGDWFEIWHPENYEGEEEMLASMVDLRDQVESVVDDRYDDV
jgi:division/cell wall cluster transcriptional repressor MraZ